MDKNKIQRMTVKTKGQLLAAFDCAKDYDFLQHQTLEKGIWKHKPPFEETEITLIRKTGVTVYSVFTNNPKLIQKVKGKIKRTKAADLLY